VSDLDGMIRKMKEPSVQRSYRSLRLLVILYVCLSWATMGAAFLMGSDPRLVPPVVWVRGGIVALVSLLTLFCALRTGRGGRVAFVLLRISAVTMLVAVIVVASIPGFLPPWFRIEQIACGTLLAGVVLIGFGKNFRRAFARASPDIDGLS